MVSVPLCTVPSAGSSREGSGCAGDGCSEPPQARVRVQPEQTCAVVGPAQLVCDLGRRRHVPSASADLSPGAEFFGRFDSEALSVLTMVQYS